MRSQPGAVAEIDVQARERLQVARVLQATRIDGLEPHALGQLVELLPEYRSIELGIYAIYPTRKPSDLVAILEALKEAGALRAELLVI